MIVEFFGVPGGGKTHLLRQLVELLPHAQEARVERRRDVLTGVARYGIRHPLSFAVWCVLLVVHANGLFRYKAGLVSRSMAARMIAENSPTRVVFIDEGMLQRLLTVFDTRLSERCAGFVLWATPMPRVAIVVRGGTFTRFTLLENRFNSPRLKGGEAALQDWMAVVRRNADLVDSILARYTSTHVRSKGSANADLAEELSRLDCTARVIQ